MLYAIGEQKPENTVNVKLIYLPDLLNKSSGYSG